LLPQTSSCGNRSRQMRSRMIRWTSRCRQLQIGRRAFSGRWFLKT